MSGSAGDTTEEIARKETLVAAAKAGSFLDSVYRCALAEHDEREDVALDVAALHNDGLIDAVAEFEKLGAGSSSGSNFFMTRHIFEKALPNIDAPVTAVMRCVLRLPQRRRSGHGGRDDSGRPYRVLRQRSIAPA